MVLVFFLKECDFCHAPSTHVTSGLRYKMTALKLEENKTRRYHLKQMFEDFKEAISYMNKEYFEDPVENSKSISTIITKEVS